MFDIIKAVIGKIADFIVCLFTSIGDIFLGKKSNESMEGANKRFDEVNEARMAKQKENKGKARNKMEADPKIMIPLILLPLCLALVFAKLSRK